MERKVARASGVRTPQEQKALHAKIAELTESLESYTTQFGMLTTQCKRLNNDLKQAKRQVSQPPSLQSSSSSLPLLLTLFAFTHLFHRARRRRRSRASWGRRSARSR